MPPSFGQCSNSCRSMHSAILWFRDAQPVQGTRVTTMRETDPHGSNAPASLDRDAH